MSADDAAADADLASRAAGGDDHAFTVLMRRHKSPLYRFVWRYVGDRDAALEVVQESFVAAWKALQRYDKARPFPVWLRTIAINKCRDRARREAVRRAVFRDCDLNAFEDAWLTDNTPGPEETLVQREENARLHAAIARLPAKLKEPLILTYFEEMSQQAAAEFLGTTVKTIETRLYRARLKLAALLNTARKSRSLGM